MSTPFLRNLAAFERIQGYKPPCARALPGGRSEHAPTSVSQFHFHDSFVHHHCATNNSLLLSCKWPIHSNTVQLHFTSFGLCTICCLGEDDPTCPETGDPSKCFKRDFDCAEIQLER
ncbi:hypothetical protein M413DRAFT_188712 [Hebeloma cylindrosporum]|uniref:Uncharacterized protein n=1 Tax=Hebeloma cylindrosporum TaxID=76867 RepID=A0A0C3C6W8_HEBCY|nr:hypothetical protein M413DRAFT_188712 [Hebeloma cylindrosporum h7]